MTTFKVGDKVRLISFEQKEYERFDNWILAEDNLPRLGDVFTVEKTSKYITGEQGIFLKELYYGHPSSKFELVSE